MKISIVWILIIFFLLFAAFSIGLNLALHGILNDNSVTKPEQGKSSYYDHIESLKNRRNVLKQEINNRLGLVSQDKGGTQLPQVNIIETVGHQIHHIENEIEPEKSSLYSTNGIAKTPDTVIKSEILKQENELPAPLTTVLEQITLGLGKSITSPILKVTGPISSYIDNGKKLPILLITCNRPELLEKTIKSLLSVRQVEKENILVIQDGGNAQVSEIVRRNDLKLLQNTQGLQLRGAVLDGAQRIAMHYKFSLTALFRSFPDAPGVIIVEDDLLFSPDFYEYFHYIAPIHEADDSVFVSSAWNDNGFTSHVVDPFQVYRTEFFPGLGWFLPRKLYESELEQRWPREHWDHWLRSLPINRGRETVYPQMPRTFHNGIIGTFMNEETHNRYFRSIAYNTDVSTSWMDRQKKCGAPLYTRALQEPYEARILEMIRRCSHVTKLEELTQPGLICVWVSVNLAAVDFMEPEFTKPAKFFNLWHEHHRGAHKGLHEFFWNQGNSYVLLISLSTPTGGVSAYGHLKPAGATVFTSEHFADDAVKSFYDKRAAMVAYPAKAKNVDCNKVCADVGKRCTEHLMPAINSCDALMEKFPCKGCVLSYGPEQPAYVDPQAQSTDPPGLCLYSSRPEASTCAAAHSYTLRLCPCT